MTETPIIDAIDELDVETFTRDNPPDHRKPRAKVYVIAVDRERFRVEQSSMTGREILRLAGKTPETHKLYQRFKGGETNPVAPDEVVEFTAPGVERFQTIPLDPTEG